MKKFLTSTATALMMGTMASAGSFNPALMDAPVAAPQADCTAQFLFFRFCNDTGFVASAEDKDEGGAPLTSPRPKPRPDVPDDEDDIVEEDDDRKGCNGRGCEEDSGGGSSEDHEQSEQDND